MHQCTSYFVLDMFFCNNYLQLVCILDLKQIMHFNSGKATATGGEITLKTVKDATWTVRAKWDHLAINLDVDDGTIEVSIELTVLHIRISVVDPGKMKGRFKLTSAQHLFLGGLRPLSVTHCAVRLGKVPFSARGSPIIGLRRAS